MTIEIPEMSLSLDPSYLYYLIGPTVALYFWVGKIVGRAVYRTRFNVLYRNAVEKHHYTEAFATMLARDEVHVEAVFAMLLWPLVVVAIVAYVIYLVARISFTHVVLPPLKVLARIPVPPEHRQ